MTVFLIFWMLFSTLQANQIYARVTKVDKEKSTFTITREPTTGVTNSKEPPFIAKVTDGDLQVGYLNRRIVAYLSETDQGLPRLKAIAPADRHAMLVVSERQRVLRRDTITRGRRPFRGEGEYLPPFALFNQFGELVTPEKLRGKTIVLNFIFTRCAVPRMCPAATQRMVALQKFAREKAFDNLQLITISFDPKFDTPGILHTYGKGHGADFNNYWFLTGNDLMIKDLQKQFAIQTKKEDGRINHTMATVLIDKVGKIQYYRPGSLWRVGDFMDRILKLNKKIAP